MPGTPENQGTSTRPYLLRALHDWCTDNGFTPYIAVFVDASVQVPMEYVKNHEIVLNVGFEATSGLKMGNEFVEFKARFGGVSRVIIGAGGSCRGHLRARKRPGHGVSHAQ
jgi:stringent starvation protein B